MEKRGRGESKPLFSDVDLKLLKSLMRKSPQCKKDLFRDTNIGEQHIKRHLDILQNEYKIIKIEDEEIGNKTRVSINEKKRELIDMIIKFFEGKSTR